MALGSSLDSAERGSEHLGDRRTRPCPFSCWLCGELTIQCWRSSPTLEKPASLTFLQQYGIIFLRNQQVQITSADLWEILLSLWREEQSRLFETEPKETQWVLTGQNVGK
ncbi:hypothetical protein I79_008543 [Cricetulus griseus]|uniref:Uncharacterized protein n=1 Tax=Cricetulus griseus TaxID=10029 RepID=G3HDE0_CRIGR|nr:hypothetical protein I79_008543 [Cricetulus griseus]